MNVAIVGVSGYTGLELIKILLNHPKFNITYLANSTGDTTLDKIHPALQGVACLDIKKANADDIVKVADIVFLALPHKTSAKFAKELLKSNIKVIDLSADYRLSLELYEKHYTKHDDIDNLSSAIYGLPEFYKNNIKKAKLIANPGCYPTASLLALLPFIKHIKEDSEVFIDAKSGVSGAGKKADLLTSYVNINENIFAYNPFDHRHSPEIKEQISKIADKNLNINFVPHLIPASRGMLISVFATLKNNINPIEILKEFYKDKQFVRIKNNPVDIKSVSGTNFCDIFATSKNNALFVSSSIDNLLRGASSQAVVNANIMCGFDEDLGINSIAYVP